MYCDYRSISLEDSTGSRSSHVRDCSLGGRLCNGQQLVDEGFSSEEVSEDHDYEDESERKRDDWRGEPFDDIIECCDSEEGKRPVWNRSGVGLFLCEERGTFFFKAYSSYLFMSSSSFFFNSFSSAILRISP